MTDAAPPGVLHLFLLPTDKSSVNLVRLGMVLAYVVADGGCGRFGYDALVVSAVGDGGTQERDGERDGSVESRPPSTDATTAGDTEGPDAATKDGSGTNALSCEGHTLVGACTKVRQYNQEYWQCKNRWRSVCSCLHVFAANLVDKTGLACVVKAHPWRRREW